MDTTPASPPAVPALIDSVEEEKRPQFVCSKQLFKSTDLPFKADDISLEHARDRISCIEVGPCQDGHPKAVVLDNVFSEAECERIVKLSEKLGFTFWDTSGEADVAYRSAFTVEVDQPTIADLIFERIQPWCSELDIEKDDVIASRDFTGKWIPERGYEKLLLGRYREGGHFSPHTDGTTYVDVNRRTCFTALLYLKDTAEEGAGRTFLLRPESKDNPFPKNSLDKLTSREEDRVYGVQPKTGRLLLFYHEDMHEGEAVNSGHEKYIIRTDIVYVRSPEILTADADKEGYACWIEAQRLAEEDNDPQGCVLMLKRAFRLSPGLADLMGM